MRTIKSLIEELNKFPPNSRCYAYEGEITGVVILAKNSKELGYISCRPRDALEDETPAKKN